jgi:Tannase and feruloyl esterase
LVICTMRGWLYLALLVPLLGGVSAAQAADPAANACADLAKRSFETAADTPAKVTSAVLVAAAPVAADLATDNTRRGEVLGAPIADASQMPAYCKVLGYVAPTVRFELRLPLPSRWNGRFLLSACDGWCGQLLEEACVPGLSRDYATATTDGGHAGLSRFDGVWGYNNPQGKIDFGYRANHVVAQASKAIVAAYYGRAARFSYITGCSKGGQAGVMAALRYPTDFDGVIATGPVLDYQGGNAYRLTWVARAVTGADDKPLLDAKRVPLLQKAMMDACDAADGLKDGQIDDPRACHFDPASLQCKGASRDDCLTATEVRALKDLYAEPRDASGRVVYPAGTIPGSEGAWPNWLLSTDGTVRTRAYIGAEQYLRYLAFDGDPGPSYSLQSFDFARDGHRLATMSPVYDATSPDLSAFEAHGGKLILLHGWADQAISPLMTIRYYDALTATMGGRDKTMSFARLFMVPGGYHCFGGTGPTFVDALAALEQWREAGVAPDRLVASTGKGAATPRTRPLYPYPLRAKYSGKGSIDAAENFGPFDPTTAR